MRAACCLAALALAACTSTSPINDAETIPVPRDRVLAPQYLDAAPRTGVVAVKRDGGFGAYSVCAFGLFVDAVPVADLQHSERIVLHLPPGTHVLSAKSVGGGLCAAFTGTPEVETHVLASSSLNYRIGSGSGGLTLTATAF